MASTNSRLVSVLSGTRSVVGGIPSYDTSTDMLVKDLTVRRLEGDYQAQDYLTGYEGAQGDRFFNGSMGLQLTVDAALPAAGSAPLFSQLLLACGLKELITADTSAAYSLRPESETKTEIAMRYRDSNAMQVTEGMRGSLSFTAETRRTPMFAFNLMGALFDGQPTVTEPIDFSGWPNAPECSPTNMSAFTVDGVELCVSSFTFSDGRTPRRNKFMNCDGTDITQRNITGRMIVKSVPAATLDIVALARNTTRVPLVWQIDAPSGERLRIAAPNVQLKYAGEQDVDGELGSALDLVFTPDQGDDEVAITFS